VLAVLLLAEPVLALDGVEATGWPMATIVRGRTVMRDGALIGKATGRPVRFQETL